MLHDIDIDDNQRPHRVYKGVKIYRVKELTNDTRLLKDGRLVPCKPEYDVFYKFVGGYKEDTVDAVKESIDRIESILKKTNAYSEDVFVDTMNGEPV